MKELVGLIHSDAEDLQDAHTKLDEYNTRISEKQVGGSTWKSRSGLGFRRSKGELEQSILYSEQQLESSHRALAADLKRHYALGHARSLGSMGGWSEKEASLSELRGLL